MAKRRINGEGTIYQRKDGLWIYEVMIPTIEGGTKRKRLTSKSLETLKEKITELKVSMGQGIITDSKNMTLNEWIEKWLDIYVDGKVKNTTYDNYVYAYENFIKGSIGLNKIDKIIPATIQSFVDELGKKYSVSTIKKPYIVMNQAYKKACTNSLVKTNPCRDITFPRTEPKQVVAMTAEEQQRFEGNCPDTIFGRLFLFALNTGMRTGEILALTWNDIDMKKRIISVKHTLVHVNNRDKTSDKKTVVEINSAKTESGIRDIPMTNTVYSILTKQKTITNLFCFESKKNTILEKRNIIKALNKVVKSANVQTRVSMHVLRHSFATRLLEKGANIKAVSSILGHKSITITLNTYSHVLDDFKAETINLLNTPTE